MLLNYYLRKRTKLKQSKIELDKLGYFTYFTPTYLMVIKNNGYTDQDQSVDIGDMLCAIREFDGKMILTYNFANVSDEEVFDNKPEMIRFIKKQFPL